MTPEERTTYWWTRAKDAEAKLAEAWDRGYDSGADDTRENLTPNVAQWTHNPYRAA